MLAGACRSMPAADMRTRSPPSQTSRSARESASTCEVSICLHVLEPSHQHWAHGVVVSHPLHMRKALGSNPSVSRLLQQRAQLGNMWHMGSGQAHPSFYPPWICPETPPTVVFPRPVQGHVLWGTWCSGITSAPHAEGPGFKSQCVQTSAAAGAAGRHVAHGQRPGPP